MRVLLDSKYKPDITKAFDHILIHTGSGSVIAAVVKGLQLNPKVASPSLETLQRFGNTGMCSTYYILANIENQVGFRSWGHSSLSSAGVPCPSWVAHDAQVLHASASGV
jgi:predicted naringenin-chalcone synthase